MSTRNLLLSQPACSLSSSLRSLPPDLTPEEKARGLARAIRKQTGEVRERWERLKGHVGGWHNQVERALERLQELQSSMDQLDLRLTRAEEAKATWQPVGDLLIDSLQDHIDKTVVSQRDRGGDACAIATIIKTSRQELDSPLLCASVYFSLLQQILGVLVRLGCENSHSFHCETALDLMMYSV